MRLREALEEYLKVRRALGFILAEPPRMLHKFVAYTEQEGASFITTELSVRVGHAANLPAGTMGQVPLHGTEVCPLRERPRREDRDPSLRPSSLSLSPRAALPVHQRRDSPSDQGGREAPVTTGIEGSDLRDLIGAPCCHRHAGERVRWS